MINNVLLLKYAKETVRIEIEEAQRMLERLDESVVVACHILLSCAGKVVISGIGKSGYIGKKIAASLSSTGTPAFFIHPSEALHGDLGAIGEKDVVIFISYSGYTYELVTLMPLLIDRKIPIIVFTGDINSPLARKSTCILNIKTQREACPMKLVPTASAVNTLMMGDALTISVMRYKGFSAEQFSRFHPGGKLGAKLWNRVYHIMRTGEHISKVFYTVTIMDAMFELSRTGLGLTAVCNHDTRVIGVFTNGDLKRWITKGNSLQDPIDIAMTQPGYCLLKECKASVALKELCTRKITAAPVVNDIGILVGSINVFDLHQSGI